MIANIHSTEDFYQVTRNTLQYTNWGIKGQNRPEKHIIDTLQNKSWLQVDDPELLKLRFFMQYKLVDSSLVYYVSLESQSINGARTSTRRKSLLCNCVLNRVLLL